MANNSCICSAIYGCVGWHRRTHHIVKAKAYEAMKRRKKSIGTANLVSDEPLSVEGTVLDPRPA